MLTRLQGKAGAAYLREPLLVNNLLLIILRDKYSFGRKHLTFNCILYT
jgi:hypothetical protein